MPGTATAVTSNATAAREARRATVLQLYMRGNSTRKIAAMLDPPVSHNAVHNDIKAYLKKQAKWISDNIDAFREAQHERYLMLLERNMPRAIEGDDNATKFVLQILKSIRELYGLDMTPESGGAVVPAGKTTPAFSVTIHETNVLAVGASGHGNGQAEAPQDGRVITVDVPEIEEK